MENNNQSFYQFSDQLRGQTPNLANLSLNDSLWSNNSIWSSSNTHVSKRPDERRNFDIGNNPAATNLTPKLSDFNGFNDTWKIGMGNASIGPIAAINGGSQNVAINGGFNKGVYSNGNSYNYNSSGFNLGNNFDFNLKGYNNNNKNKGNDHHEQQGGKIGKKNSNKKNNNNSSSNDGGENKDSKNSADKRFKTLPPSEALPRNETIGGYIFVCNNDTMSENLKRELFGLPPRYRDSVRAITPGLPLFLYNYSTHQLHGIFEAASFGGTNIDPTAWEDKKCAGESRFPAQVRVLTRKICEPLEEDSFRPILHHYDGPKFRLELSVPEAISLLDIFDEQNA